MKGLWLEKDIPRGQQNHVPSRLCHLVFYCPSSAWKRISEIRLLGTPSYFSTSQSFSRYIVGGSSYQKETPSKTNIVFMEIVEEKVILGWTLLGATDMTDGLETKSSLLSLIS